MNGLRTRMLIGEGADALASSHVAVFGLGGVGGYVAEFLARAGVGELTLADNDTVDDTNINRQIIALHSTLGKKKTDACALRIKDINPDCKVHVWDVFYGKDTPFEAERYDAVADCIDTVTSKVALAVACDGKTNLVSCMGTGNKLSARFELSDIYSTAVCPLARIMRKKLREAGVKSLPVVYSREEPASSVTEQNGRHAPASISYVPAAAAAVIAEFIIRTIVGQDNISEN